MNIANVKTYCTTNGTGVRTAVFVSGCNLHCEHCFNKIAWDFKYGSELTDKLIDKILDTVAYEYIDGISILGGEPMDVNNQEGVHELISAFRRRFGNTKTIWLWSGYVLENIPETKFKKDILNNINYLVDGPFKYQEQDLTLKFRGSKNQRILKRILFGKFKDVSNLI